VARCLACGLESGAGQRFCGACGAAISGSVDEPTLSTPARDISPLSEPPAPASDGQGRLLPGAVLAERYRVVAMVGRGGMGEVYRADDLKLGQAVALKFLPRTVEHEKAWLKRLLDEVRIARQISHPNVCRVYDVGEVAGRHFLSMEFIDGEDLASLLRRIGRLPPEKALQIARQLCAGLAAAHEQGILHRDFKPANVMIDGRGRARVMDFGLAGLERQIPQADVGSGTPAYMAPEQMEGREVTARSDVYALGLVLYEIFAGRRPFESDRFKDALQERRSGAVKTPSSHVDGLDPLVERAILRCLEPEPSARPASGLAVAALLPGGDALAAALAAGETPSPDLVAAAPTEGILRPAVAAGVLLVTVLAWVGAQALSTPFMQGYAFRRSPEGLADRSRDLLAAIGHGREPLGRAWGYGYDRALQARLEHNPSPGLIAAFKAGRAPTMNFWYRESPAPLAPGDALRVGRDDPPATEAASAIVETTTEGRLLSLQVVPYSREPGTERALVVDWSPLLLAAGLDLERLLPAKPILTPPVFADTRTAWVGSMADAPATRLRVEAAAFEGLPVYFRVSPEDEGTKDPPAGVTRFDIFLLLLTVLFGSLLAAALYLARRNLTNGRGDMVGAKRMAVGLFVATLANSTCRATHVAALSEVLLLLQIVAYALLGAAAAWVLYVALEPMLRRSSPANLVAWTRLLGGRFRDPLVGRHLLLGSAVGALQVLVTTLVMLVALRTDPVGMRSVGGIENLFGLRGLVSVTTQALQIALVQALAFSVLFQLLARGLGSPVRGALALWALFAFGLSVRFGISPVLLWTLLHTAAQAFVIARLGLLASFSMLFVFHVALFYPITLDPSVWFFTESMVALVLGMLPALYGAWVSVGTRPADGG
jgi:Protein kinase domain